VSFEPVLPPVLAGHTRVGTCVSYKGLVLPQWIDEPVVAALGGSQPGEPEMQARAAAAYTDLVTMDRVLRTEERDQTSPDPAGTPLPLATGTGGNSMLAGQFALVARCVEAGVPTRVYSVSLGGFDLHADERAGHEDLLKQLDQALSAFLARMARTESGRQVAVVVYSEFGRRVRANASAGTDHGTAGPVFVLGARVAGGLYGHQPSLTDLDDGDLKASTDFRDIYGTLLASVLHSEPGRYLDSYEPHRLPLFPSD
jgi:uncharacterized protein (DUF1501 family)